MKAIQLLPLTLLSGLPILSASPTAVSPQKRQKPFVFQCIDSAWPDAYCCASYGVFNPAQGIILQTYEGFNCEIFRLASRQCVLILKKPC